MLDGYYKTNTKKIWTFLKMNYNNGEVLVLKMPAAPTNKLSVKKNIWNIKYNSTFFKK